MSNRMLSHFWEYEGLTPPEKLVLISLADQANDYGYCWPSIDRLVRRTVSRATLFRAIAALEDKGLLVAEAQSKSSSVYWLVPRDIAALEAPKASDIKAGRIHPVFRAGWTHEDHLAGRAERSARVKEGIERGRAAHEAAPVEGSQPETHPGVSERDSIGLRVRLEGSQPETQNHHRTLNEPSGGSRARARAPLRRVRMTEDWRPDDDHLELARAVGLDPDVQLPRFRDHHIGKATLSADWHTNWREWLRHGLAFLARDTGRPERKLPSIEDVRARHQGSLLPSAPPPPMPLVRRRALLAQWLSDTSMRLPPRPAWLEKGLVVPEAQQVADLDAWLAKAAEMNRRILPAFDAPPPQQQAAE